MCAGKFLRGNPSFSKWYGEGQALALRFEDVLVHVVRGPVPRKPLNETKNARNLAAADVFCHERCVARDRPSPYGTEGTLARDRPSPYGTEGTISAA